MKRAERELLKRLAGKYVWWKAPDDALAMPQRVMSQVMDIGDYDDVQDLARQVGEPALREVLAQAEAGQFSPRSWAYWHLRLGVAELDNLPPLPVRKFADSHEG